MLVLSFLVDVYGVGGYGRTKANVAYGLVLCVESAENWPSFRKRTGAESQFWRTPTFGLGMEPRNERMD